MEPYTEFIRKVSIEREVNLSYLVLGELSITNIATEH